MTRFRDFMAKSSFYFITLGVLVFAWFNPLYQDARKTLNEGTGKALESLAILEDLHLIAEASASVKIPVISGTFVGASKSLESATKYLTLATIASLVNEFLLRISHLKAFILLLLGVWLLSLFKKYRLYGGKLLLIGLLINPGLSLFTSTIHWIDQEIKITQKESLHAELTLIHKDFTKKEEARQKKVQARKQRQLDRDKKRGRDKLTLGQRIGDGIRDGVSAVGLHLEEDFDITSKTIHFATKKIKTLIVNYFTATFMLSFFLPIAYLYTGYRVLKALIPVWAASLSEAADAELENSGINLKAEQEQLKNQPVRVSTVPDTGSTQQNPTS